MLRISTISLLLSLCCSVLLSQVPADAAWEKIREDAEQKYGPLAGLVNGEKYFYPYDVSAGTPFLRESAGNDAALHMKGEVYEELTIRYDLHQQVMVLEFTDWMGAPVSIVLNREWIEEIRLGDRLFKKITDNQGKEKYAEILHDGPVGCIFFWSKEYGPKMYDGMKQFLFSDPKKEAFVRKEGKLFPFWGKRSLLKCFGENEQVQIRTYLKQNRIRIRKANRAQIFHLFEYLNQL